MANEIRDQIYKEIKCRKKKKTIIHDKDDDNQFRVFEMRTSKIDFKQQWQKL